MGFSGDLSSIDFANILQTISINRKTGTLNIQGEKRERHIYFEEGQVRGFGFGAYPATPLPDVLLKNAIISLEQHEEALKVAEQKGSAYSGALIEKGFATPEMLGRLIQILVEEGVHELFAWRKGSFEFVDGAPPEEVFLADFWVDPGAFNISNIILEAARRLDERRVISKWIPSLNEIFTFEGKVDQEGVIGMWGDIEQTITFHVDGKKSVKNIIDLVGIGDFRVCKMLADLAREGRLRALNLEELKEQGQRRVAEERLEEAVSFYVRALEMESANETLYQELADIYRRLNRPEAAAAQFLELARMGLAQNNNSQAISWIRQGLKVCPNDIDLLMQAFLLYLEEEKKLEIIATGRQLGGLLRDTGDLAQCQDVYTRVLQMVPEEDEVRDALSQVLVDQGQADEAGKVYEEAATYYEGRSRFAQAIAAYRRILVILPQRSDVQMRITRLEARRAAIRRRRVKVALLLLLLLGAGLAWGGRYALDWAKMRSFNLICRKLEVRLGPAPTGANEEEQKRYLGDQFAGLAAELGALAVTGQAMKDDRDALVQTLQSYRTLILAHRERVDLTRQQDIYIWQLRFDNARELLEAKQFPDCREKLREILAAPDLGGSEEGQILLVSVRAMLIEVEDKQRRLEETYARARAAVLERGDIEGGHQLIMDDLVNSAEFGADTPWVLENVLIPARVVTSPPGARVTIRGERQEAVTPCVIWLPVSFNGDVTVTRRGFEEEQLPFRTSADWQPVRQLYLRRQPAWTYSRERGGQPFPLAPAIHGDRAFLPEGGNLLVLNLRQRELERRIPVCRGMGLSTTPCLFPEGAARWALVGAGNGRVYCVNLNPEADPVAWTFALQVEDEVTGDPARVSSRLVCLGSGGQDRRVYLLLSSPEVENPLYASLRLDGAMDAPARVHRQRLYLGTSNGTVLALEPPRVTNQPLRQIWEFNLDNMPIKHTPLIWSNQLIVAGLGEVVYGLDQTTGNEVWRQTLEAPVYSSLTLDDRDTDDPADDRLLVGAYSGGGMVSAYPAGGGEMIWQSEVLGAPVRTPLAIAGDRLYVVTINGVLFALERSTGQIIWRFESGAPVESPPLVSGDYLLLPTMNGKFHLFER